MTNAASLPQGFAHLEPFVDRWALSTSAERAARRSQSTPQERADFFAATQDQMPAALEYLDKHALNTLGEQEQRLMDLMLSLAHISLAVELQGPDEVKSAKWRDRMRITRATSDFAGAA